MRRKYVKVSQVYNPFNYIVIYRKFSRNKEGEPDQESDPEKVQRVYIYYYAICVNNKHI